MNGRFLMLVSAAGWLAACDKAPAPIAVPFVPTFAGEPLNCAAETGVVMTDLRFYVHNLRLESADGEQHDVQLTVDDWQQPNLALLDFEDGSGSCLNGTPSVNDVLRGTVSGTQFKALEFTLGVPFNQNHGDPLQAAPPLDDADMHWHWRGGYKFLRAGVKSGNDSFWLHLGSTGCEGTIRNITGCNAPNRITVRIEDYQPGDPVQIDLAELVGDVLNDESPSDCSSGPAEIDCRTPFSALGLVHSSGAVDGEQRLFTSQPVP